MGDAAGLNRRTVLGAAITSGVSGLMSPAHAQGSPPASRNSLPGRENIVIRGAYILTMDASLGDIPHGDIHMSDGRIVAVGTKLEAPGATVIDGATAIVMPGLVETHWHMWNTLLRGMAKDTPAQGYFATVAALGKVFSADDMYQGTRLAAAEAINGGITYVHSWCHNTRTPEYAHADLRALRESGIRARFSYGWVQGQRPDTPANFAELEALKRNWKSYDNDGLIALGFGWWGVILREGKASGDLYRRELETARSLGLPVTVHANSGTPGQVAHYASEKLLGKDIQIVNPINSTDAEIQSLAEAQTPISFSPVVGMRIGRGFPQPSRFLGTGCPIGLAIDDTVLGGNADMFAIMKLMRNSDNAAAGNEYKLPPRRILELATITGARSMGVDDRIGSLTPGKRADLIMIATDDVNLAVFSDPVNMVVDAVQPANVDTVIIDGRILKRQGKLTAIDKRTVAAEANAALTDVRKRATWW